MMGTRKFISFSIISVCSIFYFLFSCIGSSHAQEAETPSYYFQEVVVTANRFPGTLKDINRSITIITAEDIAKAPVNSLHELLAFSTGVDIMRRGALGIQADISIRGSTFEQVLVLIDGVKVNDPQTGHHSLNVPVSLADIERVEILRGAGSRLYGPNAFGGVVNIITRKGERKQNQLGVILGDYSFFQGDFSVSYPLGKIANRLSVSSKMSDGYLTGTDFKVNNIFYRMNLKPDFGDINLTYGFLNKKFGAYSFYTDQFPNQWEETNTNFLNISADIRRARAAIFPKIYWRRNSDDFILDRARPDWYRNQHTTNNFGLEVNTNVQSQAGVSVFGWELGKENISSSNLGDHSRVKAGLFLEHKFLIGNKLSLIPGGSVFYYSNWGGKILPGLDVGIQLNQNIRVLGNIGKAFRIPTFTELYYESPANKGNPLLKPEHAWNYEIGLNLYHNVHQLSISLFRREARQLIDWVRTASDQPWQAENIANMNTNGVEFSYTIFANFRSGCIFIKKIHTDYTYLSSTKKIGNYQSKYALNYLRHKINLNFEIKLWKNITQSWQFRYEDRINYEDLWLINSKVSLTYNRFAVYLLATNLLNVTYVEAGYVPMPGRWLFAGLNLNLSRK